MMRTKRGIILLSAVMMVMAMASGLWAQEAGKVDINTASAEVLMTLDGIGPVYAERIVEYREANGPFKSAEDIRDVSGIGPKTFEQNKDRLTVGDNPAATGTETSPSDASGKKKE